ncbi:MAG: EF-P lysine aminoacylase GenX [Legionellales bacterium]|nr:EF-P lysine aminoacylase GenX [Legionellales bacterium]
MTWKPNSSLKTLTSRANILREIRNFFMVRDVLEVETPLLASTTNPDPNIGSLQLAMGNKQYLQTSPEFYMKRLLASHRKDIFQICKAFRKDESGRNHQQEFTMLEWYRIDFDYHQLMHEVGELVSIFVDYPIEKKSYTDLFLEYVGIDPFNITASDCEAIAEKYNINLNKSSSLEIDSWLDLFLSQIIEPKLTNKTIFVYDYKASQASLAKIRDNKFAERFELYIDGIEMANGFSELIDPKEQAERFKKDNVIRQGRNLEQIELDDKFIKSLEYLPNCSGVALGIDRLIKCCLNKPSIQDVMSFSS